MFDRSVSQPRRWRPPAHVVGPVPGAHAMGVYDDEDAVRADVDMEEEEEEIGQVRARRRLDEQPWRRRAKPHKDGCTKMEICARVATLEAALDRFTRSCDRVPSIDRRWVKGSLRGCTRGVRRRKAERGGVGMVETFVRASARIERLTTKRSKFVQP